MKVGKHGQQFFWSPHLHKYVTIPDDNPSTLEQRIKANNQITQRCRELVIKADKIIDRQSVIANQPKINKAQYNDLQKQLVILRSQRNALESTRPCISQSEIMDRWNSRDTLTGRPSSPSRITQRMPPLR